MTRPDPHAVDRLIERILDTDAAEWPPLEARTPASNRELEALQTLSDIARVFRRFDTRPRTHRPAALFHWGHLAVLEKVATGGSADVYCAWDEGLGTRVALKLLRVEGPAPRARAFLDEARRMARIRHHHVLSVYGAATHDGRPGLWCEWIDGQSLDRWIEEHGAMSPEEAIVLGLALCRALGAVHAAGLMHGDVKPGNVLRERGGRIVLADLGAAGSPAELNASLRSQATPAWLAPEVLRGALRTPQQDLYGLGRVLQYALTARVPEPSSAETDLVCADLALDLRGVVERACAAEPATRFRSAAEMERALHASLGTSPQSRANRTRGLPALAVAVALAVIVALWWLTPRNMPPDVELALLRHHGAATEALVDGAQVAVGDRLSFRIFARQALWFYAFADDDGQVRRLFPVAQLDNGNPLPAGRDMEIPGHWQGRSMRFEVSSEARSEDFLLVAARAPVAALEELGGAGAASEAELHTRGTAVIVPATTELAGTHLDALAAELARKDAALRIWRFRLPHAAPLPKS